MMGAWISGYADWMGGAELNLLGFFVTEEVRDVFVKPNQVRVEG